MFEVHRIRRSAFGQLIAIIAFAAVCAILYLLAHQIPEAFFSVYTPFSRTLAKALAFLFSFAPFSIVEFALYALVLFFLGYLIFSLVRAFTRTEGAWALLRYAMDLLFTVVFLIFLFVVAWGLNYLAPPLEDRLGLNVRERPEAALIETANWLLEAVNAEAGQLPLDADGAMDGGGFDNLAKKMPEAFKALEAQNDIFRGGGVSPPKRITIWLPFTYMSIAGIYSPYTGECNVNPNAIDTFLPYTMAHEMAHRYGFAAENDANFIAFKACQASPDAEIRYSGAVSALFSCMRAIDDAEALETLRAGFPKVLWADIAASQRKDEALNLNPELKEAASSGSSMINDAFLKTVGLEDGIKSYGRVVDLLIAEYVRLFGEPSLY